MENEIIKIETTENGKQAVSARALYEFLGLRQKDLARWTKKNITDNAYAIENEDYMRVRTDAETPTGGKIERYDYILTIDFAKKLCMLSRTEKGNEARNYFVECEKKLKLMQQDSYMITDPVQRAKKWIVEEQERQRLAALAQQQAAEIAAAVPKIEYHDRVLKSETLMTTTEIAADYGLSAIALNRILLNMNIQYKKGSRYYLYSRYNGKGYTGSKTATYDEDTKSKTSMQWTQAGREFIFNRLRGIGINPVGYDEDIAPEEQEQLDAGVD